MGPGVGKAGPDEEGRGGGGMGVVCIWAGPWGARRLREGLRGEPWEVLREQRGDEGRVAEWFRECLPHLCAVLMPGREAVLLEGQEASAALSAAGWGCGGFGEATAPGSLCQPRVSRVARVPMSTQRWQREGPVRRVRGCSCPQ